MSLLQSRRDFTVSLSATGATSLVGGGRALAAEGPPETTTIRLRLDPSICIAPLHVAKDLLRAEGFTDIQYVLVQSGPAFAQAFARGEIDFAIPFAGTAILRADDGLPVVVLAGVHAGCYELFVHEPIRTIRELKGKRIGIDAVGSGKYAYMAAMAAYVGLDPRKDIEWVAESSPSPMELFAEGKVDAFLGFPPEPQELRAHKIGRMIVSTTRDKPWSQYFCCVAVGNKNFVRSYPVATRRVLRAILKASEICAAEPAATARQLVDGGFTNRYDYALQTLTGLPYTSWREFDAEDSLRFFALRLHEAGMIRTSPNKLRAEGTDWHFLNELKRELKA